MDHEDPYTKDRQCLTPSAEKLEATRLAWETARASLEREIGLLWQRGIYFWTFVAAIFAARAANQNDSDLDLLLSCLGFLISLCWTLANFGSKYWQGVWEQKVKALEKSITGSLYEWDVKMEATYWLRGRRFSVSRMAIAVSLITSFFWLTLALFDAKVLTWKPEWMRYGLLFGTFLSSVFLTWVTYSGKSNDDKN